MDKKTAVAEAARKILAHGRPACLTDPRRATDAMDRALDAGATHDDIAAEVRRQRTSR